jgi:uncharacterized protein YqeY
MYFARIGATPVCMLADEIKKLTTQAMKNRDDVAKNILRLALGEMQTAEAREGRAVREDEAFAIVRKLVKSNEETLAAAGEGEQATILRKEIAILSGLLPATMSVAQIVEALAPVSDGLKAAKNDGQATGLAMKHLKTTGATFDGTDVSVAVKQIRGGNPA